MALTQGAGTGGVGGPCLDGATPSGSLAKLVVDGVAMPLGVYRFVWSSAEVVDYLYALLAQDALGYEVVWTGASDYSVFGLFAVAGCDAPTNVTDPQCNGSPAQTSHAIMGFWGSDTYNMAYLARHYPTSLPEDLGSIGHSATEGLYVTRAVRDAALADGVHLEYYGDYHTKWHDVRKYFDDYKTIPVSDLLPCSATEFHQSDVMATVTKWFPDPDSIGVVQGGLKATCPDGFWWLSPGCRASPSRCIPQLSGGDGWYTDKIMQRAIAHSIPLAMAVAADGDKYKAIPHKHRMLVYWWQPSDEFLDLSPLQVVFPPYNASEWAQVKYQSAGADVALTKIVYKRLSSVAPRAYKLAQQMSLDMSALNTIMQDVVDSGDTRGAACRWLRANVPTWTEWLPRATECSSGNGLVAAGNVYVGERAAASDCAPCGAGNFSQLLVDQEGVTRTCRACDLGAVQPQRGSDSCESCEVGYYQNETGQSLCRRCDKGTYAAAKGSSACAACPAGRTTDGTGFRSAADCLCAPGSYLSKASGECIECGEGVVCAGFGAPPMLSPGWMTLANDSTVYKCDRSGLACPGGVPVGVQACSVGSTDIACGWCLDGYRFDARQGMCKECAKGNSILWVCFAVIAAATAIALRPPTVEYGETTLLRVVRTTFITLTLSQIVDMLQICSIWSGSAIRWSSSDNSVLFGIGGIFSFNTMSPDCELKGTRENHAARIVVLMNLIPAFFIAFVLIVALPDMLSPTLRRWRFPSRINGSNMILGAMVSFFTTILNLAINLVFSMYEHPGIGQRSLRVFPYVLESSKEMNGLRAVAGCSLAVWCVGTIVLVAVLSVYLQTGRPTLFMRRCTVALIVRYRDGYNWWLVVEMLLKFLVAISVAIFARPDIQLQWMIIVFLVYLVLLVQFKPYRFLRHTLGEVIFTCGKILILVLVVTSVYVGGPAESGVFGVLIGIFGLCLLYLVWCIVTLVKGRATEPATDYETLAIILYYLGYHHDPRGLFEVVPESEEVRNRLGMSSDKMAAAALEKKASASGSLRTSSNLEMQSGRLSSTNFNKLAVVTV